MLHVAALVCGLLAATSTHADELPPPDASPALPLFAAPTQLDRAGRILAPVMINGQGPFRLIVDTGASHSTVSTALAQTLGLEPSGAAEGLMINGVTGSARVPVVFIDRLQAGELLIKRTRMPVVQPGLMAGADGVLGLAGLRSNRVYVDFRKDKVVISRDGHAAELGAYGLIRGSRIRDGLIAVDARIRRVRALAIIDTGAERSLGNLALREALRKQLSEDEQALPAEVTGVTLDVAAGEAGAAPSITLGDGITVADVAVTFGDFHIFKVWDLEKRPALLVGMDILGLLDALEIDFERAEVRVVTKNMHR